MATKMSLFGSQKTVGQYYTDSVKDIGDLFIKNPVQWPLNILDYFRTKSDISYYEIFYDVQLELIDSLIHEKVFSDEVALKLETLKENYASEQRYFVNNDLKHYDRNSGSYPIACMNYKVFFVRILNHFNTELEYYKTNGYNASTVQILRELVSAIEHFSIDWNETSGLERLPAVSINGEKFMIFSDFSLKYIESIYSTLLLKLYSQNHNLKQLNTLSGALIHNDLNKLAEDSILLHNGWAYSYAHGFCLYIDNNEKIDWTMPTNIDIYSELSAVSNKLPKILGNLCGVFLNDKKS
jgi:hypothetical protein